MHLSVLSLNLPVILPIFYCLNCNHDVCEKALSLYNPGDAHIVCSSDICEVCKKYMWIVNRAQAYAEVSNTTWQSVLQLWKSNRDYWWMNYYQDATLPNPHNFKLHVLESKDDFKNRCQSNMFVCLRCGKKIEDAYVCSNCGCNVHLHHLAGKHTFYILTKNDMKVHHCFRPIEFEDLYKQRFDR